MLSSFGAKIKICSHLTKQARFFAWSKFGRDKARDRLFLAELFAPKFPNIQEAATIIELLLFSFHRHCKVFFPLLLPTSIPPPLPRDFLNSRH
jgi:uncharacterized membrane protein